MPPRRRPPSPFLLLLASAALTGLGVEWMRFQWGWGVAALPALAGGVWSLWHTARAFRARRAWRRAHGDASTVEAGVAAPSAEGEGPHAVRTRAATAAERPSAPATPQAPPARDEAPHDAPPAAAAHEKPAVEDTLAER